ncbi:MAG: type II toxin-antitoxin system VapC family toxin [Methanotrichaceae archaeon]|nr:type II toxin-antitoxin system VapC family toxin [Methanotrichaceae archaeon]
MPGKAVLDSSVIAAMFFKEEASHRVLKDLSGCEAITVDLAIVELGNVAWKRVVLAGENKELAWEALEDGLEFIVESCMLIKSIDLAKEAYEIAIKDNISFYDGLFLAAADREQAPLITLDKKLHEKAKIKRKIALPISPD